MPFCGNCGKQYTEGMKFCGYCGASLGLPAAPPVLVVHGFRKEPGIIALAAALVGIFLFGVGHFIVGKVGRGLAFLFVGIIVKLGIVFFFLIGTVEAVLRGSGTGTALGLFLLLVILNFVLWIWQIYDPYALAKKYNAELERTGKALW